MGRQPDVRGRAQGAGGDHAAGPHLGWVKAAAVESWRPAGVAGTARSLRPAVCRCSRMGRKCQARERRCRRHRCRSCLGRRRTACQLTAQLWHGSEGRFSGLP
jgi:hypothetical protein